MSNPVIETNGLNKNFGRIAAVKNLSIQIQPGQVFGILGPNGSGKSTTLGMLSGVTNPSGGTFKWFGQEGSTETRKKVGIILERPNFYPYMSAYKNLKVVAGIKGLKDLSRIDTVLKKVDLFERRNDRFKTFSLGMKQRLSIASALLVDPEVLILDEPTNGLDPQGISDIRNLIIDIAKEGKTIILASHLLYEVQKVCTHFMILKSGNLMHIGPVAGNEVEHKVELAAKDMAALKKALEGMSFVKGITLADDIYTVEIDEQKNAQDVNEALFSMGITASHLVQKTINLEQKFLEILAQP